MPVYKAALLLALRLSFFLTACQVKPFTVCLNIFFLSFFFFCLPKHFVVSGLCAEFKLIPRHIIGLAKKFVWVFLESCLALVCV